MDEKLILEAIQEGFNNVGKEVGSKLDAQLAELNETAKKILEPSPEDVKTAAELKAAEEAKLEQGTVAGISEMKVWDIPLGQAALGGFVAVFASELIDGFLVQQGDMIKGVVKLIGAGAAVKWGGRLLGSTGSKAVAILLAYDGIRSLIPIDTWAKRSSSAVTGMIPGGGLGGFNKNVGGVPNNGHGDYYEEKVRGAA